MSSLHKCLDGANVWRENTFTEGDAYLDILRYRYRRFGSWCNVRSSVATDCEGLST